jgi:NitT/TauT family transport system substrate-binding protein
MKRRGFLAGLAAAGIALGPARAAAADPPPETKKLALARDPTICPAPMYVAEELRGAEGFTEVRYVPMASDQNIAQLLGSGKADLSVDAAQILILAIDGGESIVLLGGVHAGCYELFATPKIRTVRELKGKTIAISQLRDDRHALMAAVLTHVGLDPRKDIRWVTHPAEESMRLLAAGKVDAFLGFPPEPQALRAKKIGHVLLDTRTDRPWSQYFCCMLAGNREFVRKNPVATKRAIRAVLKANALCASEPDRVARFLVDRGYLTTHDYAVQTLKELSYGRWRDYDPEDTARFYALRLHEGGMIRSTPQKLLMQATDWRFFNELKKELKG